MTYTLLGKMRNIEYLLKYMVFALILFTVRASGNFGPLITATKGDIWPKPQEQNKSDNFLVLQPQLFQFVLLSRKECPILRRALVRYEAIIQSHHDHAEEKLKSFSKKSLEDTHFSGNLHGLNIILDRECSNADYPTADIDESYALEISDKNATLHSQSVWGILKGLETFSQSIYVADNDLSLRINITSIKDQPRFGHRGLMLDTSRHYIPVEKIRDTLDAMAYNKLNVFHWHIVDDESFPYVSQKFPKLSEKGAYKPYLVYTVSDVKYIIEYARDRGIRIIPEFDSPGHTSSWGNGHRELLTECYFDDEKNGDLGPIDPTKNTTYKFLEEFFQEISEVFEDRYIHLGGDEVGIDCWYSNPNVRKFIVDNNITTYHELESFYMLKLMNIVDNLNRTSIVWEDVFSNEVPLPNETIVHVWKQFSWDSMLDEVTKSGKHALLSGCWYLDTLMSGGDWDDFYKCEPFDFGGSADQQEKVLGGEACMWAEMVDDSNLISRVWPRASAAAERLWSPINTTNIEDAQRRLEEHYCRLKRRGIDAQPSNGPGFCD